jgi:hypothetical protein
MAVFLGLLAPTKVRFLTYTGGCVTGSYSTGGEDRPNMPCTFRVVSLVRPLCHQEASPCLKDDKLLRWQPSKTDGT